MVKKIRKDLKNGNIGRLTHYAYGVPLNVRFDQRFNSSGPKNEEFKSKQQICV